MFKFGFKIDDSNETAANDVDGVVEEKLPENECIEVIPAIEDQRLKIDKGLEPNCIFFEDDVQVFHIPFDSVINEISSISKDISCAEQKHADVVPGVYEGGAKVWECTQDLGMFLTKTSDEKNLLSGFADKTVLDLGCGAGILGILALKFGSTVHFQDYNEAVLQHITIPNTVLNVDSDSIIAEKCRFYSGDWLNYIKFTENEPKFDRILTSETIYNPNNYKKILNLFKAKLKPDGIVYLAAKTFYFGVGGSLRQFENYLKADGTFMYETVQSMSDNVAREILKITYCVA